MKTKIKNLIKSVLQLNRIRKLKKHGDNVWVGKDAFIKGNVEVGSNVNIGRGARLVSSMATIKIHDYVVFGPDVTVYTGDHATDVIGKHIIEVTDADKKASGKVYDKDVVIEAGCWIGTRAIILKGVTIGKGSVIGAGAVVTKDVPPYSVYVGVPQCRTFKRFSEEEILQHETALKERSLPIS